MALKMRKKNWLELDTIKLNGKMIPYRYGTFLVYQFRKTCKCNFILFVYSISSDYGRDR
jgi:hypothetical protein